MPYNLLLPLIAGFWFSSRSHLLSYTTSTLGKEAVLLHAALWGLAFLVAARIGVWLLMQTDVGADLAAALHAVAPFPFVGTALSALCLAFAATALLNHMVPPLLAASCCYHGMRFDALEMLLLHSAFGAPPELAKGSKARLLGEVAKRWVMRRLPLVSLLPAPGEREPRLVMLTLNDGKVYTGYVVNMPPLHVDGFAYVRLLPTWSGYRDAARRVLSTTFYPKELLTDPDQGLVKLFPRASIVSASLYVDGAFNIPNHVGPAGGSVPASGS